MRSLILIFGAMVLTACQPTLAPQPIHTVNLVPMPALTKHHTDDDTKLTLHIPDGVKPEFVGAFREHLEGRWLLMSLDGFEFEPKEAILEFKDGQGSADVGCNAINFSYQFQNNLLKINNLSSTRMACDNPFENEFVQFLRQPLTIKAEPTSFGTLIYLNNSEGKQLSFVQSSDNKLGL